MPEEERPIGLASIYVEGINIPIQKHLKLLNCQR